MQAYLTLSLESLARPQEILYTRIKDVELSDNYAKVYVSEHGKEGTKFLICIESYNYLTRWIDNHPFKGNKESFLFTKYDKHNLSEQLTPKTINERIRIALKNLKIDKPITCYSIKRNGVTFRRLRGDTDVEIQKIAGWTSTKQLKVYDMSEQEDVLKSQLLKRGMIKDLKSSQQRDMLKICFFCGFSNKFTNDFCDNCKRLLDRDKIRKQEENNNGAMLKLKEAMLVLSNNLNDETKEKLAAILK